MTAEKGQEFDATQIVARIPLLSDLEVCVLGLMSKGWCNRRIAARIQADGPGKVNKVLTSVRGKLGTSRWSREALAVLYVRYILPTDTWLDYPAPGMKLAVWTEWAEGMREALRANNELDGWPAEAIMHLTDLRLTNKPAKELMTLLTRQELVTVEAYRAGIIRLYGALPGGNKVQLVTVAALAPFDAPVPCPMVARLPELTPVTKIPRRMAHV